MFCDGCGTTLLPNTPFCSHCGRRIIQSPQPFAAPAASDRRVTRHLHALSMLWLAYGVLRALLVLFTLTIGTAFGGPFHAWWPENLAGPVAALVSFGFFSSYLWSMVLAGAYLLLAWALYERRPWARIFAIVLGFVILLKFPLGTALGIFTLWVFLPERSRNEYQQLSVQR